MGCRGQPNGIYNIPNQCRKYLTCADGIARVQSCPANLVFDELANEPGQAGCQWLENAKRTDCSLWEATDQKREMVTWNPLKDTPAYFHGWTKWTAHPFLMKTPDSKSLWRLLQLLSRQEPRNS